MSSLNCLVRLINLQFYHQSYCFRLSHNPYFWFIFSLHPNYFSENCRYKVPSNQNSQIKYVSSATVRLTLLLLQLKRQIPAFLSWSAERYSPVNLTKSGMCTHCFLTLDSEEFWLGGGAATTPAIQRQQVAASEAGTCWAWWQVAAAVIIHP